METGRWRIQLFGALTARQGELVIRRFRSRKTALLLAYLALHCDRAHPREQLIELFWPETEPDRGRMSLRTALASLRRQLEPPGVPFGSVIAADSATVHLNPGAVVTDVSEFLSALESASKAEGQPEQAGLLEAAVDLYRGELLPGFYADWILAERRRLEEALLECLRKLMRLYAAAGAYEKAARAAERAVETDPLREESHRDLMRLYAAMGRPSAALEQYARLTDAVREQLGAAPSRASRALADRIRDTATPLPATRPARDRPADHVETPRVPVAGLPGRAALPLTLSRFFGRTNELAALAQGLAPNGHGDASRLYTLTGPGGVGKTRTAIEAARSLQAAYGGRVWYVPLADARTVEQIASAIAGSMLLERADALPLIDQIAGVLAPESSLLVLDNFEQAAERGVSVVSTLLARAGPLKALVTSRRRLALEGERELPLRPLGIPGEETDLERLLRVPSVQLFVDRAQAALPDFQLTPRNARAVSEICRILEGIPLAIELAAARAQVLPPARLAERLSERFAVLQSVHRDRVPRHQSLWAAIDWSYQLLSPRTQRLFRALSVFRGGFTEEAAAEVCEESAALELITHLRLHSLLQTAPDEPEMRFTMLETIREFAEVQLGDETAALRDRHAQHYAALASASRAHLAGPDQAQWLSRLDSESANLREALETLLERGDGRAARTVCRDLWRFWWVRGHTEEAAHSIQRALALAPGPAPAEQAEALQGLGNLAWRNGEGEKALGLYRRAFRLHRQAGDRLGSARSLGSIGNACRALGRAKMARNAYSQSLQMFEELQDAQGIATSLLNLGTLAEDADDLESASQRYSEALQAYRALGDLHSECLTLCNLGNVRISQGRAPEARSLLSECGRLAVRLSDFPHMVTLLAVAAKLALLEGGPVRAAVLIGAFEAVRMNHAIPLSSGLRDEVERTAATARQKLSPHAFESARASGSALSASQALDLAFGGASSDALP